MKEKIINILEYIWSKSYGPFFKMKIRMAIYRYYKNRTISRLLCEPKIRVIFFTINLGMWKYDDFFRLLLGDKRFEPYIVSLLNPSENMDIQIRTQSELENNFKAKGFPFINSYDSKNKKWFNIKTIRPDIIFYPQPYNKGYKPYMMENFFKEALFFYIPYTFMMERSGMFFNTALHNLAFRLFYPSEIHKQIAQKKAYNKGRNVVVTGHPLADYIYPDAIAELFPWKIKNPKVKRVIWAPHHSILADDTLNYSRFLQIADDMLKLAEDYKEIVQFAFKPHPGLKKKLYGLKDWGASRTDAYYKRWEMMSNTILSDGEYIDLFNTSDALIHDCSSFSGEYLFTLKPVMYLSKVDHLSFMNEFGTACYECHYKGETMTDVKRFIEVVVIGGNDPMLRQRKQFYETQLKPSSGDNVAKNMYIELKKCVSHENYNIC